ncbi:MAG: hypothetical protein ACI9AH_001664, partial [Oceanospirillaceae bacterium]
WANRNNQFGSKLFANSLVSSIHDLRILNSFYSLNPI